MVLVYPGSFDPITTGHMDIINRASRLADTLIVGLLRNPRKETVFTVEERLAQLKYMTESHKNIEVREFSGLLADFARSCGARAIVRAIRNSADLEYEMLMAHANREMAKEIEVIFLPADTKFSYISSTLVKEIHGFGGDISGMVPEPVKKALLIKKEQTDMITARNV